MADINLDNLVDYEREYTSVISHCKVSGSKLTGCCPFHPDKPNSPSFSADLVTGMWKCFSEDEGGNFVSFEAKRLGIDTKEAYQSILDRYGVKKEKEKKEQKKLPSLTLQDYSEAKHIPVEFLKKLGIKEVKDRSGSYYLRIPYYDKNGAEATFRKRYGEKQFLWSRGAGPKICLYGRQELSRIDNLKNKYVVLVEGESDTQAMMLMHVPCLGVPGASMFRDSMVEDLKGKTLYIHQEPDDGGKAFVDKILKTLRENQFKGNVLKLSLAEYGVKDPSDLFIRDGNEASKEIMQAIKASEPVDIYTADITDAIPDAPIKLRQPEGWRFSEKGISRIDQKTRNTTLICRTPILLHRRLKSLETREEKIQVAFKRDDVWTERNLDRSTVFTSRGITILSDLGCTVTSENSRDIVRYLQDLEADNIDLIQKVDSASKFGWQPGRRFIPGKEDGIYLDVDPSQKNMESAYSQNGTLDGWIKMVAPHRQRSNKFRFILAASFAAPLLRILKQRIFFVYNWGGSKSGKTAGLKAAASVWGDPEKLMVNFNATKVGLERTASFFCDLPLCIDERQLAGNRQDDLESIVYMIAQGTGKLRGSKSGGIQTQYTWRTIALATGEEPLSTETTQTGVASRVIEIYGGPFDDEREASMMHQTATENCGWAGPLFVNQILQLDESEIVGAYELIRQYVYDKSEGKDGSHIACIASVTLADAMIESWIFNSKNPVVGGEINITDEALQRAKDMADTIIKQMISTGAKDVNVNATQFISDWIQMNDAHFQESIRGNIERYGFIEDKLEGRKVYVYPSAVMKTLTEAGYSPRKTIQFMSDNDLIEKYQTKDGKITNSVMKWNGNNTQRYYSLDIKAIGEFLSESFGDTRSPEDTAMQVQGFTTADNDVPF